MAEMETRKNLTSTVKRYFLESGSLDGQSNSVFEREINASDQYAIDWTPVVIINDEKYSGNLMCSDPAGTATCPLFTAICAAFAPETIPSACSGSHKIEPKLVGQIDSSSHCIQGKKRDRCGVCNGDGSTCDYGIRTVIMALLVLAGSIIALQCGFGVYLRIQLRRTGALVAGLRGRSVRASEHINQPQSPLSHPPVHARFLNDPQSYHPVDGSQHNHPHSDSPSSL